LARLVRFGVFQADLDTGDLLKQGLKVRIRGKPFEILALLIDRRGEVVTREELRQRLWAAETFVDFDHGVNTAVNRLREALGDSADNPRFIETIPRKGYRFIASIQDAAPAAVAPDPAPLPEPRPAAPRVSRLLLLALAAAVLAAAAAWIVRDRSAEPAGPTRLAVLPFRNVSGDAGQEYFADGLTDALIADLAQVSALRVISRTSVMSYKATAKRLPEIARELGVDSVVEGSVLRSGGRVRITARVVDAALDRSLWSETYERDLSDVLALQREVARAITLGVRVSVTPQEQARLEQSSRVNPEAYEAYLRGRYAWQTMSADGLRQGVEQMERAIAIDPRYAPAYSGLAYCYWVMGGAGFESAPQTQTAPRAKAAAQKALEIDPGLAAAQATLAMLEIDYDWDFPRGESRMRQAIASNPGLAEPHISYSAFLAAMGRGEEAIAEARRGLELDPLSQPAAQTLGYRFFYARQHERAREQFRKTLEANSRAFVARIGLAQSLWEQGERKLALPEAERALADSSESPWILGWLGHALAASGDGRRAQEVLERLQAIGKQRYVSPVYPAMVHAGRGDRDAALRELEAAHRDRSGWMVFLGVEPSFDPLRGDPRFVDLLRRIGHALPAEPAAR
jgi:TolB-like protein/Flp pilus assembly protein TadD